jgi:hypothetical protein
MTGKPLPTQPLIPAPPFPDGCHRPLHGLSNLCIGLSSFPTFADLYPLG